MIQHVLGLHPLLTIIVECREELLYDPVLFHSLQLLAELEKLVQPVPRDQFTGLQSTLEKRQLEFAKRKGKVDDLATECYDHTSSLIRQLEGVMRSSRDIGHPVSYIQQHYEVRSGYLQPLLSSSSIEVSFCHYLSRFLDAVKVPLLNI